MASKALMSSPSALVVSNRAAASPLAVGFGPRQVSFSFTAPKKVSSRPSLVVKSQFYQEGAGHYSRETSHLSGQHKDTSHLAGQYKDTSNPAPVHAPWTITEDEFEFKMRLDMPGVAPEDIDIKVEGNLLVVKDLARQLYSPHDTKVQLPTYCVKQEAKAILKNGVLHVSMPKSKFPSPVFRVPVKVQTF